MTGPPVAFYRLADAVGSFSVADASGNANTGSLISGLNGTPVMGVAGPFLFDVATAVDLTAGQNTLNGGCALTDNSTQPPTAHNPLSSAAAWSVVMWAMWTSTVSSSLGQTFQFVGDTTSGFPFVGFENGVTFPNVAVGDGVVGPNIPYGTVITGISQHTPDGIYLSQNATGTATQQTFTAITGQVGSTLFAGTTTAGEVDIRVGSFTGASVTYYNRVTAGAVTAGNYVPSAFSNNDTTQDGNWHQVAITYAAFVATIYIDGLQDSTWSVGNWSNPINITIGCNAGAMNGFVGSLSHVALYNYAITAAQVANQYKIGKFFQHVEPAAGAGITPRLNSVLLICGLPLSILNIPYPFMTDLYAETNSVTTTSALNYIQTVTESEPGLIYQGPNGMINAFNREYQWINPTSTISQGVFGDSSTASYHYNGPALQVVEDDIDLFNDIQVQSGRSGDVGVGAALATAFGLGSSGAVLQEVTSQSSASVYGARTLQGLTSLQMNADLDALAIAEYYLALYKNPIPRVQQMTLDSFANGGNNLPQMLQRQIMDRITVQYAGQSPSTPFSQDSLIESVSHSIDMSQPSWSTTYALSPHEILLDAFFLDSSTMDGPTVLVL